MSLQIVDQGSVLWINKLPIGQQRKLAQHLAELYPDEALKGLGLRSVDAIEAKILTIVAEVYDVNLQGIVSSERRYREARWAVASLMYSIFNFKYRHIGETLRRYGVDHTTVRYWINNAIADDRYYEAARRVCEVARMKYESVKEVLPRRTN